MENDLQLEDSIKSFGRNIFAAVSKAQPSTFDKHYWSGRVLEWSLTKPEFKTNMFRLVDVLPSLKTSSSVAHHVREYMGGESSPMHSLLNWGFKLSPALIRNNITAVLVKKGVSEMAAQFIAGEKPESALAALKKTRKNGMCFTVDLLGELSVSEKESAAYLERYLETLEILSREMTNTKAGAPVMAGHPGEAGPVCISIKLTALYSQCGPLNFERSVAVLSERLGVLARKTREVKASLYVDAEDHSNNPVIFAAYKQVFGSPEFRDFPYPGIVVQAYEHGAEARLKDLLEFAKRRAAPIAVRLVKGAYWDQEFVQSSQQGWKNPLFLVKAESDANYERLSRVLIDNHKICLPAFASHNIRSLSHACCYAAARGLTPLDYELQMLYGMADPIARAFQQQGRLVRLYVPLGEMLPGMGYLVRRLMENTSNESFLKHTFFDAGSVEDLLKAPRPEETNTAQAELVNF